MNSEPLRRLVEALPEGASVTLQRATLVEWLGDAGGRRDAEGGLADLRVEDVARELDRSPSTVRGWLISGEVPEAYKLKKREWRVPRGALRAFLDRQASEGRGAPGMKSGSYALSDWRRQRPGGRAAS